jgi:hypothetical protein
MLTQIEDMGLAGETHIHPDEDMSKSPALKALVAEIAEADRAGDDSLRDQLVMQKLRAAFPKAFCGANQPPSLNENLVEDMPGRDYCKTCLAIYKKRR